MIRIVAAICAAIVTAAGWAQAAPSGDDAPLAIPLAVSQNHAFGTYKARIDVAIGNAAPLAFGFDTGSSGLHVFADANLDAPGSGVRCTQTPTSVTYGNPARITYTGVVCYAQLHFQGLSTPSAVPIAYLTSATCPPTNPGCTIPDLRSPRAMNGYGVFGAGLTGVMAGEGNVPNPFLTLPGHRGSVYSITLRRSGGEVLLGADEPSDAVEFALRSGGRSGERYSFPQTCVFVNGRQTNFCPSISFDTGNGVPWIHSTQAVPVPQVDGFVKPGTRLGFAPPGDAREATALVAGSSFADKVKVVTIAGKAPLTNVSIQAFLDRVVTYDDARGVIAVAPAR
ncbi:MAG: hypothetical protein JOZ01_08785 [Candidatus Eremiobacteraeota bacterium]|nr:hypothetical protein [Candidatus Eremiobacteraeota bacterium]